MPSKSSDHSSPSGAARISLALLLTVLMVFPNVALAQTTCNNANKTWTAFPFTLPNPIETLNAVVNNGYLYVVGGSTGVTGFQSMVSYTQLSTTTGLPVTSLTSFGSTTSLPTGLSRDLCGVAYNGYLYTVGGVEPSTTDSYGHTVGDVQRAKFHHPVDGTIETWMTQPGNQIMLPAVQLHGTVVLNGYMYVIGGSTGTDASQSQVTGNITDAVYYAQIGSNGSIQPPYFRPTSSLPIPLYKTCPIVVGNTIYMFGGETDANHSIDPRYPAVDAVYYATQNQNPLDGTLSGWTKAPYTIPLTRFVNPNADGLASQALVYVNTKGAVFMGGDTTGSGGDTNVVLKGANITDTSVTWSYPNALPGTPPQNTGYTSRNAGATLNHFAYSVAGLYQGADTAVVNCLLVP